MLRHTQKEWVLEEKLVLEIISQRPFIKVPPEIRKKKLVSNIYSIANSTDLFCEEYFHKVFLKWKLNISHITDLIYVFRDQKCRFKGASVVAFEGLRRICGGPVKRDGGIQFQHALQIVTVLKGIKYLSSERDLNWLGKLFIHMGEMGAWCLFAFLCTTRMENHFDLKQVSFARNVACDFLRRVLCSDQETLGEKVEFHLCHLLNLSATETNIFDTTEFVGYLMIANYAFDKIPKSTIPSVSKLYKMDKVKHEFLPSEFEVFLAKWGEEAVMEFFESGKYPEIKKCKHGDLPAVVCSMREENESMEYDPIENGDVDYEVLQENDCAVWTEYNFENLKMRGEDYAQMGFKMLFLVDYLAATSLDPKEQDSEETAESQTSLFSRSIEVDKTLQSIPEADKMQLDVDWSGEYMWETPKRFRVVDFAETFKGEKFGSGCFVGRRFVAFGQESGKLFFIDNVLDKKRPFTQSDLAFKNITSCTTIEDEWLCIAWMDMDDRTAKIAVVNFFANIAKQSISFPDPFPTFPEGKYKDGNFNVIVCGRRDFVAVSATSEIIVFYRRTFLRRLFGFRNVVAMHISPFTYTLLVADCCGCASAIRVVEYALTHRKPVLGLMRGYVRKSDVDECVRKGHPLVGSCRIGCNKDFVAVAYPDFSVSVFQRKTLSFEKHVIKLPFCECNSVEVTEHGLLVLGLSDGSIHVYDCLTGKMLFGDMFSEEPMLGATVLRTPGKNLLLLGFSEDGVLSGMKVENNHEKACGSLNCRRRGDKSELKRCSRCRLMYYCSKKCQLKHWKVHKKRCKKIMF